MVTVLSLGGSIVSPSTPDVSFLISFAQCIREWLLDDQTRKLIMVVGGGAPARTYQNAYREYCDNTHTAVDTDVADWIGITATYLNAQLVKSIFSELCLDPVVHNPTEVPHFSGRILIAAGWKPGFSTDNDAVLLAENFSAKRVVNLSNIEKVYTDDPKKNPDAKPIDTISWGDFISLVGTEWVPGKNSPFDPVASVKAQKLGLEVICASGKDMHNLKCILNNQPFVGTTIK